jgi:hypothetical protein
LNRAPTSLRDVDGIASNSARGITPDCPAHTASGHEACLDACQLQQLDSVLKAGNNAGSPRFGAVFGVLHDGRDNSGRPAPRCPSSDDLRRFACFRKGGSGSSVIEIMQHAVGAASDGLRLSVSADPAQPSSRGRGAQLLRFRLRRRRASRLSPKRPRPGSLGFDPNFTRGLNR